MDPAIFLALLLAVLVGFAIHWAWAFRRSRLPLEIGEYPIRRERAGTIVIEFRVRLGHGRRADRPRAIACFRSRGDKIDRRVAVSGPARCVVGPWTMCVPDLLAQEREGAEMWVEVSAEEHGHTWVERKVWCSTDVRSGSFVPLATSSSRAPRIDRRRWERIEVFSTEQDL